MVDQAFLYSIIYALAAKDGREQKLFGQCSPLALEAFKRSCPCEAFPELWFEVPLAGEPWFDLHVLTARESLAPDMEFTAERTGGCPEAFRWFARQPHGVRQLALSYDVGSGSIDDPAVQLLVSGEGKNVVCGFLEAAGKADAIDAYCAFIDRLPQSWFACYTGVFPTRPGLFLRVECIPDPSLQRAYAEDAALLKAHLEAVGLRGVDDELVARCQALAALPFQLEFQFNVEADGSAGSTLGVSLRFASPPGFDDWKPLEADGLADELMGHIVSWGLADERWRLLLDAQYAKGVKRDGESILIYNFPAFVKLRWRDGKPVDAKAYFMAGVEVEGAPARGEDAPASDDNGREE